MEWKCEQSADDPLHFALATVPATSPFPFHFIFGVSQLLLSQRFVTIPQCWIDIRYRRLHGMSRYYLRRVLYVDETDA